MEREEHRRLYHTALAHGANHLITLVNECAELLSQAGVEVPDRVMAPILSASLDNALRLGDRAITGPVMRGDAGTVAAHLQELHRTSPETVPGYRAMARRTADRAERAGILRPDAAVEVRSVIDQEGS